MTPASASWAPGTCRTRLKCLVRRVILRWPTSGVNFVVVPEPSLVVFTPDHAVDIERVHEGEEEVALLLVARPGDLRHAVLAEIDLGA